MDKSAARVEAIKQRIFKVQGEAGFNGGIAGERHRGCAANAIWTPTIRHYRLWSFKMIKNSHDHRSDSRDCSVWNCGFFGKGRRAGRPLTNQQSHALIFDQDCRRRFPWLRESRGKRRDFAFNHCEIRMRVLHFHDFERAAGETGKIPCIIKSEKKRCYPAGESDGWSAPKKQISEKQNSTAWRSLRKRIQPGCFCAVSGWQNSGF